MKEDKIREGKLMNIDDRLLEISEKLLDLGFTKIGDGIYKNSAIKWEEGVLFHKGEVVKHNGKFYINTSDHKSNWANIPNINTEERWIDYDPSCVETEKERECQCECNHKGYNLSDEYEQAMRDYEILWGEPQEDKEDMINYPKHYNMGEIQTLDYIDDVLINNPELTALDGYYLGNILKYGGTRLGNKGDKKQDMGKMKFYSDRWNKHYE